MNSTRVDPHVDVMTMYTEQCQSESPGHYLYTWVQAQPGNQARAYERRAKARDSTASFRTPTGSFLFFGSLRKWAITAYECTSSVADDR